jgi:hypothetical protein
MAGRLIIGMFNTVDIIIYLVKISVIVIKKGKLFA